MSCPEFSGDYSCVRYYETDDDYVPLEFPVSNERLAKASAADFQKIPGSPIAYWVSKEIRKAFEAGQQLSTIAEPRLGMATGDNDRYVRAWHEVAQSKVGYGFTSREDARRSKRKWFPYNKGGAFRRWYGNNEYLVNWENDGHELQNTLHPSGKRIWAHNFNLDFIFIPSITWTFVSSSKFGIRQSQAGFLFDVGGSSLFPDSRDMDLITGFLGSKLSFVLLQAINPTLNFQAGNVGSLPVIGLENASFCAGVKQVVRELVSLSKSDWDSSETSWDFRRPAMIGQVFWNEAIAVSYFNVRQKWKRAAARMRVLEEENNRFFIEEYGLQAELRPDVLNEEITLSCNPPYRFDGKKSEEELEALLLADTMREFISYAVGCMFGRYSLDKPGLILANQGDTLDEYLRQIPEPSLVPDADNVIPLLDGDWFPDDVSERFKAFLRLTFGNEHYEENLAFIEAALGRDIRSYFLREFYDHHVKLYKKRPIYWLFSSPQGSFNALIYLHRYQPDTVSVVYQYLRDFRSKLNGRRTHLERVSISLAASQRDKTEALKEIDQIDRALDDLQVYEDETLYPLATRRIEIDLDDGVKVNYNKFGAALKKVSGLSE